MDINERRDLLKTQDNPNRTLDYIVTLEAQGHQTQHSITFRYIPDKVILEGNAFAPYVHLVLEAEPNLEGAATTLLEDMNNELVPRWLQVIMTVDDETGAKHHVAIEDHQPQWGNASLLARITTL